VRNVRRDGNKAAEQAEKAKEIGEDERDSIKNDIQDLTKKHEKQITDLSQARENDVMED
jgi:ribosome recycling factor